MFWARRVDQGTCLGLSSELLKELGVVWNYFPRVKIGQNVFHGQALATIQSTDKLKSLTSPISGQIIDIHFPERPDTLTDKKVLFMVKEDSALSGV